MRGVRSSRARLDNHATATATPSSNAGCQAAAHVHKPRSDGSPAADRARNSPVSIVRRNAADDDGAAALFGAEGQSVSRLIGVSRHVLNAHRAPAAPTGVPACGESQCRETPPDSPAADAARARARAQHDDRQEESFSKPCPTAVPPPTVAMADLLAQLAADVAKNKVQTRVIAFHTSRRRILRSRAFTFALRATRRLVSTLPKLRTRLIALQSAMECDTAIASYQLKCATTTQHDDNIKLDSVNCQYMDRCSSSNTASSSSASTAASSAQRAGVGRGRWGRGSEPGRRAGTRGRKRPLRTKRDGRRSVEVDVDEQNAKAHLNLACMQDDLDNMEKSLRASRAASEAASSSISCAQDVFVLLSLHVGVSTTPRAARGKSACGLAPFLDADDCLQQVRRFDDKTSSTGVFTPLATTAPTGAAAAKRRRLFARRASAPEISSLVEADASGDDDTDSESGIAPCALPAEGARRGMRRGALAQRQRSLRQIARNRRCKSSKRRPPSTTPDAYVATLSQNDCIRNEDLPLYVPFADDDLST